MKRLVITVEARFFQTVDGEVWTENHFANDFWDRYLEVFDSVRVIARALPVDSKEKKWKKVNGDKVEVYPIPYYVGPIGYFKSYFKIQEKLKNAVSETDKVLMRVGSPIADLLQPILLKRKIPYAVEVVGDPWDVFGPGVFHHPLRPFFRWYFARKLKNQCKHAAAGSYVTQEILQKRYPLKKGVFSIGASTIKLLDSDRVKEAKKIPSDQKEFKISNIGSLEYMVKGTDVLIKSIHYLKKNDPDKKYTLNILGEGRCRPELEELVKNLGIEDNVNFIGSLPSGKPVQDFIDSGDLFILPSRSEGLPRAMIEAMGRGCFCLGTDAGGIRELIPEDQRAIVGNSDDLGRLIKKFTDNIDQLNLKAQQGLNRSKDYLHTILKNRRYRFYKHLSELT